jgi:TRAP-type C4-dicarboxylate transport system substrate-binding protein
MSKSFARVLVATLAFAIATQTAAWADPIVMKIGTATAGDAADSQFMLMTLFKKDVEADSKGRISVQLYPNSELGSIPREIEGVQFGAIQGFVGAPEFLVGVDERYQLLSVPGVFHSVDQFYKTVEDPQFNKAFLDLGADKGLKGIGVTYAVPASIISRKPIVKPSDIAGMKIRTLAGPLQSGMIHVLGATAVPMPLDQVLPGLQQGVIDAVLAGLTIGSTFKYYTVAKYLVELNQPYVGTIMVISKTWFDQLPPDLQKIVSADGQKAAHDAFAPTVRIVEQARQDWVNGGGQDVQLTALQQAALTASLTNVAADAFKDKPASLQFYSLLTSTASRYK